MPKVFARGTNLVSNKRVILWIKFSQSIYKNKLSWKIFFWEVEIRKASFEMAATAGRISVFSIWKSLRVLQNACIKIVALAIYTHLFFSYTYTVLFCWTIKSCCDRCFSQQNKNIIVWGLVSILQTAHTTCSNSCNSRRYTANANVNVEANC